MGLEGIMLSEISQSERQLSYDLPDMRNFRCMAGGLEGRGENNETRWDQEGHKP